MLQAAAFALFTIVQIAKLVYVSSRLFAERIRTMPRIKYLNGFTLIELLIVVAIIAILAAIAVPNFLEAQTRAKCSRVHNDLRVLATGLETYRISENRYPPGPLPYFGPSSITETWRLTTPVAYLNAIPKDIFVEPPGSVTLGRHFGFGGLYLHYINGESQPFIEEYWLAFSYGPDKDMEQDGVHYDTTNGTLSSGDIYKVGAPARTKE